MTNARARGRVSECLAAAATDAGVDVVLRVADRLPHAHPLMLGTPEAAAAAEQIGAFLSTPRALNRARDIRV
jgi:acetyl esterase/lipase